MTGAVNIEDIVFKTLSPIPRSRMRSLWDQVKHHDFAEMSAKERDVALIMVDHDKAYFDVFEQTGSDGRPASDAEVDPYVHVILHYVVEHQVENREPDESHRFYAAMRERQCTHHDAIHLTMRVFSEFVFDMIRDGVPFDDRRYAKLLTELTDLNPTQIPSLVEKAFSG